MNKSLHLHISGRVQGVCYRASAQMKATELSLMGFARNLTDGRVEIVVTGEHYAIEKFVIWCRQGPAMANVTKVTQQPIDCTEQFGGFDVRY